MVTKTVDPLDAESETEYDEFNQKIKETDELGNVTAYEYDDRGNTTQITSPDGAVFAIEYNENDSPAHVVDAIGGEWHWAYDDYGRLSERTDPLQRVTKYNYQGPYLVGMTDPAGGHTALGYDADRNLAQLRTADGAMSQWQYDALGRPHTVTDPKENVQRRTFDQLGRVIRVDEPDGNARELGYDPEGNVTHARDQHHNVAFTYQGMGRMASRTEADTKVRFAYDTEEQLTGIINEHGYAYRFELGPTGEVDTESGFDGLLRKYTRDAAGRVALRRPPRSAPQRIHL